MKGHGMWKAPLVATVLVRYGSKRLYIKKGEDEYITVHKYFTDLVADLIKEGMS